MEKENEILLKKLHDLQQEHQELNEIIDSHENSTKLTAFTLQRFKKRRLLLKDQIREIKNLLYPDIIA